MERVRTTISLPAYMLGGLKEEAKRKKQSLSSLVEQTLHDSLFSLFHQPNETTKAAMREAEAGIELEELTAEDIENLEQYIASL